MLIKLIKAIFKFNFERDKKIFGGKDEKRRL